MKIFLIAFTGLLFVFATPANAQVPPGTDELAAYDGLFRAAADGDVDTIKRLTAAGAKLNARDGRNRTPLMVAAHQRQYDAARALIAAGATTTLVTSICDGTALIAAAHLGHDEVVRTLIHFDAPLDHINDLDWTALIEAIVLGDGGPRHVATVGALVDAGADLEDAVSGRSASRANAAIPRSLKYWRRQMPNPDALPGAYS